MTSAWKPAKIAAALALCMTGTWAYADWIGIQLPYNQFGHLENVGGNCAPTATANSFQYLQNRYGAGAGNLIPGAGTDLASARDKLINGWTNAKGEVRAGMGDCGASERSWWETKSYWVTDFGSSHVKVDGQVKLTGANPFAGWYWGDVLENVSPTWDFLWREISHGEDIELGIRYAGGAHAITLTSLKFDDTNGNMAWDAGEARKLDYLDPNDTSKLFEADLTYNVTEARLEFVWDNGQKNSNKQSHIALAYTESVPAPGVLLLLALGLSLLWFRARRTGGRLPAPGSH
ncbi:MAG: hypothetical protein IT514_14000 [Burkholderiales bacterium]|nr:hypothetical protein [Burkholderiales bacterium]